MERMSGLELTAWRSLMGLAASDLAGMCGVDVRTVQRWEADRVPMPGYVVELVGRLRVEHDSLVAELAGRGTVVLPRARSAYEGGYPRGWYVAALGRALGDGAHIDASWDA